MRFTALGFAVWLLIAAAAAGAQDPGPQRSVADGVTISVTPTRVAADSKVWTFKVVLDTHSQDLSDDVAAGSTLVDGKGREVKAIGWDGAAPGGHHREGVLAFPAFDPVPDAIELRISRAGESAVRSFRWQLK